MKSRRNALLTTAAGLAAAALGSAVSVPIRPGQTAAGNPPRIVIQHDVYHVMRNYAKLHPDTTPPFAPFRDAVFAYVDEPGSQIDAVWWDIGGNTVGPVYPSRLLPPVAHPLLRGWLDEGVDWVRELVDETRRRGLEVFWSHRFSEVDGLPEGGHEKTHRHPLKAAHPDWTIPCSYWWQGMWSLASPGLREHKVDELRELATNYDLDGIQIDFARHIPCLPVGHQWELREHATAFMRQLRAALDDVGRRRERPYLLAARVPHTVAGCRADGFDIRAWAEQGLVEVLTLGTRSMDVEVEQFRQLVGANVRLQPCFDDHHATDGYRYGSGEFLRGVFANHWQRGADSVVAFNWSIGTPEVARAVGGETGPLTHQVAFREIGAPRTLAGKDKIFAIERRGGYPWADGYLNRNDDAPLPLELNATDRPAELTLRVADDRGRLTLRCVFFGAPSDAEFEVQMNGHPLSVAPRDPDWKDAQIFSPERQPTSGGKGRYRVSPGQQLLRIDCPVPADAWRQGANQVQIRAVADQPVKLEKVEGHLLAPR